MNLATRLPIDEALPALKSALARTPNAVLVAPPGAGKTTRVPLALLAEPWRSDRRIIVLEPRRLAARGAAFRMAETLGEPLGETIGLRARLDVRVSARTRIEVVTEGVFARMILDDPTLDGVAAVLFDEFHERSLDADMGLALALDAQAAFRDDLRILIMSATLDGARVAALLGSDVPIIESAGRMYPVETRYRPREPNERIEDAMARAILAAIAQEDGSILAFLPGHGEIMRVAERLAERIADPAIMIAPLYGAMDRAAQDRAVAPAPPGKRKIVLATAIAETSITIEGVRVVIDSGLARVPRHEPDTGVTRLETVRAAKAQVDQRRGRAGRTAPGVCIRLWSEPEDRSLPPCIEPEIKAADLAGLALDLAHWGVRDVTTLRWLDPPPAAAMAGARAMLRAIGALDPDLRITVVGKAVRSLPVPPRLARMLLAAASISPASARQAALIAAVLVERGLGGTDTSLSARLTRFGRENSPRAEDMRKLAGAWAEQATRVAGEAGLTPPADSTPTGVAAWVARAWPDRIARARTAGAPGQFLLANGRGARVEPTDALATSPWLAVAELTGTAAEARILLAEAMTEAEAMAIAGDRIATAIEAGYDPAAEAVRARRVRRLDAIVLASDPAPLSADVDAAALLAEGVMRHAAHRLPWGEAASQLRDRIAFLRRAHGPDTGSNPWPDVTDDALRATALTWLAPFLAGKTALSEIGSDDLHAALSAMLTRDQLRVLDAEAPTHFLAPTGSHIAVDYSAEGGPAIAIRVQELYGLSRHPSLAGGRVPLTLHLLSPAHRPIQITKDLPGFWSGSWGAVKTEMKGRYPRHVWPDDPAKAPPTTRAKPRGT